MRKEMSNKIKVAYDDWVLNLKQESKMHKEMSNKIEEAYMVFWVDDKDNDRWDVIEVSDMEESKMYLGREPKKYVYDMREVEKWIRHHLGNVKGQIGIAKISKIVKVELVEQKKC